MPTTSKTQSPADASDGRGAASRFSRLFSTLSNGVAQQAGRPAAFLAACAVVVAWAVSGPLFGFSDTWQLVINTGTTIVTFLMVFLIQNTQNRDSAAIQAKLDELILVSSGENEFIGIEHLSEEEVKAFRRRCETAARDVARRLARGNGDGA